MCIKSITCEKLPPETLTATDGGIARPMLRALNTSHYRTCAGKSIHKEPVTNTQCLNESVSTK